MLSAVRPLRVAARSGKRIERILAATTRQSLVAALGAKPIQHEAELVAALNQAAVVASNWVAEDDEGHTQRDLIDDVVARASGMPLSDNAYRAMLKAYLLFGKMAECKHVYGCIADVAPDDVGAGMMAAAATGDHQWARNLWRQAEQQGVLSLGDTGAADEAAEILVRHFLSALIRANQSKTFERALTHATTTLKLQITSETLLNLILAAPSPGAISFVWDRLVASGLVTANESHYSSAVWCHVTTGDPAAGLELYYTATGLHSTLPLHSAAVEAYLTLFHHLPTVAPDEIAHARQALQKAVGAGASADWVCTCENALAALDVAKRS